MPIDEPPAQAPATGLWSARGLPDLALLMLTVLLLCVLIARPFLGSLAWALALAVVGWPAHRRIDRRIRWPAAAAAGSTVGIGVLVIAPAALLLPGLIAEAANGCRTIWAQIESNA